MRRLAMYEGARLVTAEEFERMPQFRGELVQGRLVEVSPVNLDHGTIVVRLGALLDGHVRLQSSGAVGVEVGFKLASNPDTVRAPDIAFVGRERLAAARRRGFVEGPPDLAIEVLSPDDRTGDIRKKIDEYLTRGTSLVVIVDPDERVITVHRLRRPATRLTEPDEIVDLGEVLPGFRCALTEIFD